MPHHPTGALESSKTSRRRGCNAPEAKHLEELDLHLNSWMLKTKDIGGKAGTGNP